MLGTSAAAGRVVDLAAARNVRGSESSWSWKVALAGFGPVFPWIPWKSSEIEWSRELVLRRGRLNLGERGCGIGVGELTSIPSQTASCTSLDCF